jgi:2-oxoglutarate ferredoxin oxidoreductase subunit alpha
MAIGDVAVQEATARSEQKHIVNDFSIQVATVNGSGSQSANNVLLRSIFNMGVPVSGKNLFPSNIAGLPTWFTIRASKHGYVARKKEIDFLIAMNPETAKDDALSLAPGSAVMYDEPLKLNEVRSDLVFYPVPFDKLVAGVCPEAKLRKLVKNMLYVGVLAQLIALDLEVVERALRRQFAKKVKAADLNWGAVKAGFDYAAANLVKKEPFLVERMHATDGKIIIDGNAACALGAMFAGVTVVTWYPITPSSSVCEQLIDYMKKYRIGPDGKATFAIVQAVLVCRPRTSWLPSAWFWARAGRERAP